MKLQICSTLSENNNTNTTNCSWMEYKMCYYWINKSASDMAAAVAAENLHKWLEWIRNAWGCAKKNPPKFCRKYSFCRMNRDRALVTFSVITQYAHCTVSWKVKKEIPSPRRRKLNTKKNNNLHEMILLAVGTYK